MNKLERDSARKRYLPLLQCGECGARLIFTASVMAVCENGCGKLLRPYDVGVELEPKEIREAFPELCISLPPDAVRCRSQSLFE